MKKSAKTVSIERGIMWRFLRKHISGTYMVLAVGYIAVAAIFLYVGLNQNHAGKLCHLSYEQLTFVLLAVLLLGPPLWFLTEYNHVFDEGDQSVTFEQFKYNQDLASRVWAAVSALALAIVFKKIQ